MKPQVVIPDYRGVHNGNPQVISRIKKEKTYKDLSTIIICPTRGLVPAKVVQSWMGLLRPMNQKVIGPLFAIGMEVGEAYNFMIESILSNNDLSSFKYLLTIEEDNMPPPDGLLKLYESIEKFDVVGGLYWTKGEGGQPMIYGNTKEFPKNFVPQLPEFDKVQEANGLGMGFNLFRMSIFKDNKLPKPWFKTVTSWEPNVGSKVYTQDLYFYENAGKCGYRFASDNRVRVGHYDIQRDIVW